MNITTYVSLAAGEQVVGEYDPPPMPGMSPSARLHFGRIYQDQRVTLSFASLEQVKQARAELEAVEARWHALAHDERMAALTTAREAS